jgi:methylmalonyl-CoA mutase N-terminal domain/subunit
LSVAEGYRACLVEQQSINITGGLNGLDNGAVANSLEKLKQAAKQNENTMPAIIEAVAAYATVEEICVALRDVYGIYEEPAF